MKKSVKQQRYLGEIGCSSLFVRVSMASVLARKFASTFGGPEGCLTLALFVTQEFAIPML